MMEEQLCDESTLNAVQALGWRLDSSIMPGAWEPDLVLVDGHGATLCIEYKLGRGPLHSSILSHMSQAKAVLELAFPRGAYLAVITTQAVSPRLEAAFRAQGIDVKHVTSQLEAKSTRLASIIQRAGVGRCDGLRITVFV